jgi:riboflavin synthase
MFTGIISAQGTLIEIESGAAGSTIKIRCPQIASNLSVGDSVSIDGVCLTLVACSEEIFKVEVTPETLRRTTLGDRQAEDIVNLEPAARMHDFIGGHLVQGHVDDKGHVAARRREGNSNVFRIEAPRSIVQYLAHKGSVTVNGVSLTISSLDSEGFEVTIIPHTEEVTSFGNLSEGDLVNLEVDVLSKYVEAHIKRIMATVFLIILSLGTWLPGAAIEMPPNTVLIYNQTNQLGSKEFIIRVARFKPDVVLEWESSTDQGTVQIYGEALESAEGFTLSSLFQVGMHNDTRKVTTLWFSRSMFDRARSKGSVEIEYNRIPLSMKMRNSSRQRIFVNGQEEEVDAIVLKDNRGGKWLLLDDRNNPLILQYKSPYFESRLTRVLNTGQEKLRWIKTLPPIK